MDYHHHHHHHHHHPNHQHLALERYRDHLQNHHDQNHQLQNHHLQNHHFQNHHHHHHHDDQDVWWSPYPTCPPHANKGGALPASREGGTKSHIFVHNNIVLTIVNVIPKSSFPAIS